MDSFTSSKVPAAESILRILTHLSVQRGPVGAQEIARSLELPRSTVYHLLNVAVHQGFVLHYPEESKYGLGPQSAELSSAYVRQEPIVRLAAPLVARMVDEARESGHLATLYGHQTVYLLAERAARRPPLVTSVGVRLMAHATASGRAMLSRLTESQLDAVYASQQHVVAGLKQRLDEIRAAGYSVEHSEVAEGLDSVSAPVSDRHGWPVAAMTLTFAGERTSETKQRELIDLVRKYALALEKRVAL
ncbi:MAG: IclR family transcriptional regulator [Micrococcaceae bacterium]